MAVRVLGVGGPGEVAALAPGGGLSTSVRVVRDDWLWLSYRLVPLLLPNALSLCASVAQAQFCYMV